MIPRARWNRVRSWWNLPRQMSIHCPSIDPFILPCSGPCWTLLAVSKNGHPMDVFGEIRGVFSCVHKSRNHQVNVWCQTSIFAWFVGPNMQKTMDFPKCFSMKPWNQHPSSPSDSSLVRRFAVSSDTGPRLGSGASSIGSKLFWGIQDGLVGHLVVRFHPSKSSV